MMCQTIQLGPDHTHSVFHHHAVNPRAYAEVGLCVHVCVCVCVSVCVSVCLSTDFLASRVCYGY